ncbi:MAG: PAS domain S-box protein [Planctomycetes bacterium]|nr:PAS domain S-box protein [Planctomycetota bacterium]
MSDNDGGGWGEHGHSRLAAAQGTASLAPEVSSDVKSAFGVASPAKIAAQLTASSGLAMRADWLDPEQFHRLQGEVLRLTCEMVFAVDLDGRITLWNRAAAQVSGYAADEAIGQLYTSFFEPGQPSIIHLAFGSDGQGEPPQAIYRLKHRSDQTRLVRLTMSALRDADGTPLGCVGSAVDVTDSQAAEESLRQARDLLLRTEALAHIGTWQWDLSTQITDGSPELYRLFQVAPGERVSFEQAMQLVHPDDRERMIEAAWRSVQSGDAPPLTFRFLLPDGTERWVNSVGSVERNAQGEPTRLIGFVQDITETKRVEQALRAAEQRLRETLDGMYIFVWLLSADGRVCDVNAAPLEAADLARGDVLGRQFEATAWWRHCAVERQRLGEALGRAARGEMVRFDITARLADDRQVTLDMMLNPLLGGSRDEMRIVCSAVDITERLRNQHEAQRQQQELTHVLRVASLGEMSTSLAHELNQPLAAVANYVHALGMTLAETPVADDPRVSGLLHKIEEQAIRAGGIVQRLRALVRRAPPRRAPVDVTRMTSDVLELLLPDARLSGVQLEAQFAPDLPMVEADAIQIQQVIVNLVRNAIEALEGLPPERKRIDIHVAASRAGWVTVTVADHGAGVPEPDRDRVFHAL